MFCNKCGKEIDDGSRFCNHCGATLTPAPAPVQTNTAPIDPGKSYGDLSYILGIVSLVLSIGVFCTYGSVNFIACILGIVFGFVGKSQSEAAGFENKKAKTGILLSFVALGLAILFLAIFLVLYFGLMISIPFFGMY